MAEAYIADEKALADRVKEKRDWRPVPPHFGDDDGMFLSSIDCMVSLTGSMLVASLERRMSRRPDRALRGDRADASRAARALLGRDDRFITIPFYSDDGGIADHLAKWAGVAESSPYKRVYGAMIVMLDQWNDIMNRAESMDETTLSIECSEMVNHWSKLCLGFTPGQIQNHREDDMTPITPEQIAAALASE